MEELKCSWISEIHQSEKAAYGIILIIWHYAKYKLIDTVKLSVIATSAAVERKGWRGEAQGLLG